MLFTGDGGSLVEAVSEGSALGSDVWVCSVALGLCGSGGEGVEVVGVVGVEIVSSEDQWWIRST